VFGLLADGAYAHFVSGPATAFYDLTLDESALDDAAAACLHCTFGTAFRNLVTRGGLRAGESVLVTGANGGVGVAAVQIARRLGARVTAAVRDARHVSALAALGAHETIVAPDGRVHEHAGGFDLVLENVGAAVFPHALRALRMGGRIAVVGNIEQARVQVNLGQLIAYGLSVVAGGGATPRDMARVLAMHAEAPFVAPIAGRLPLAAAEEAHRRVLAGGLFGRWVLVPESEGMT
jgi:NADPH:quinone reductase-like Zn-dependent oxidoreductase